MEVGKGAQSPERPNDVRKGQNLPAALGCRRNAREPETEPEPNSRNSSDIAESLCKDESGRNGRGPPRNNTAPSGPQPCGTGLSRAKRSPPSQSRLRANEPLEAPFPCANLRTEESLCQWGDGILPVAHKGDSPRAALGTYFTHRGRNVSYLRNISEPLLLRSSLLNYFRDENLEVVEAVGGGP